LFFPSTFPEYRFQSISQTQIRVESAEDLVLGPLVRYIEEQGSQVAEARRIALSLEDVFVQVTGLEPELLKTGKVEGKNKG
jgi:ABC-2 type transport system ATP-binding protein